MTLEKILIIGVTASGKGRVAFELAEKLGAEIISIDSMKVYKRMDIGTAKPPKKALQQVRYHLINVVEPSESFSVGAFLNLAYQAIEQIRNQKKSVIAVGGTALYIKSLLYGLFEGPGADQQFRAKLKKRVETEGLISLYKELTQIDPVAAERISSNDTKRIIRALEVYHLTGKPISNFQKQWNSEQRTEDRRRTTENEREQKNFNWKIIGLRREKDEESKKINARVKKMITDGLVDEVKSLLAEEKPMSLQAQSAIGYSEIIDYLNGRYSLEDTVELIKRNTRRLAKHQRTWFKTFRNVNWIDIKPDETTEKIINLAAKLVETL